MSMHWIAYTSYENTRVWFREALIVIAICDCTYLVIQFVDVHMRKKLQLPRYVLNMCIQWYQLQAFSYTSPQIMDPISHTCPAEPVTAWHSQLKPHMRKKQQLLHELGCTEDIHTSTHPMIPCNHKFALTPPQIDRVTCITLTVEF